MVFHKIALKENYGNTLVLPLKYCVNNVGHLGSD